ncbi:MAG: response regulator [Desulfobacteraceae bacterium]|nr:response regulator [Desulfobacteraceae bacterium]
MEINPITLAFRGQQAKLEKTFLQQYIVKSLPQIRVAMVLGLLLIILFGILDIVVAPELKEPYWLIRFAIISPAIVLGFVFTFSHRFLKYMQITTIALMLITGLAIVYMTMIGNGITARTYYAGLILVIMVAHIFCRMRFILASPASIFLIICYYLAAYYNSAVPLTALINNMFFSGAASITGMLICYMIEYYARRDFFMEKLLDEKHQRVETNNCLLEEKVEKRTAMLGKANDELRKEIQAHQKLDWEKKSLEGQLRQAQKMEAVGTLAGGIAHDFNNILAAIMGHTELALLKKGVSEEMQNCLNEVLSASERARDLVRQILSFSRNSESELNPIQINLIVQEALRLLRASLPANISIDKDIQAKNSIVVADATQIHQILMNLCTNAAHAIGDKNGSLKVCLKSVDISLNELNDQFLFPSQLRPGEYVCLSVSDTGHGIPLHLHERIFDPYFTTKDKEVGTGLGLAVVCGIVQNHGGIIDMRSLPGKGTTFEVYLPRAHELTREQFSPPAIISTGKEHILLVDDDKGLSELGAKLLATLGYRVKFHTEPVQALSEFRKFKTRFDLVITDMIMPEINGESLSREILKIRPDIPVIIYTGFSDSINQERLDEIGVKKILRKPITINRLSKAIRQVLGSQAS